VSQLRDVGGLGEMLGEERCNCVSELVSSALFTEAEFMSIQFR
jgi:hypothetical protein